jgi:prophage regulatory protein
MKKHEHVGVHEIAERIGTSRQWVHKLLAQDETFPKPVSDLKAGKVWHTADVEAWLAKRQSDEP